MPVKKVKNEGNHPTFILLAAGVGRRVNTYGPQQLWNYPQTNTPLIVQQINLIRHKFPFAVVVVVLGYEKQRIAKALKNKNIIIAENDGYAQTGPVESLRIGLGAVKKAGAIVVMHTDIIFSASMLDSMKFDCSNILIDNHKQIDKAEIGILHQNSFVVSARYDWPDKWCQVITLKADELAHAVNYCASQKFAKYHLHDMINHIISKGGMLGVFDANDDVYEIDSHKDYTKIIRTIK